MISGITGKTSGRSLLSKIFDMFYRASEESYGSDLGLYSVKQVIEKLRGHIQGESVLGRAPILLYGYPTEVRAGKHGLITRD